MYLRKKSPSVIAGAVILLSLYRPLVLYAVVAPTLLHELVQPDGTIVIARQWGDEWFHGWETEGGYTIIKDEATRYWHYAERTAEGDIVSTGTGPPGHGPPIGLPKFIRPKRQEKNPAMADDRSLTPRKVLTRGTFNIPVILINFSDRMATDTAAEFEELLFGDDPAIATGPGSLKDYYREVSYDLFVISKGPSDISGWHDAPGGHDYYGGDNIYGLDSHAGELVVEAVQAADEAGLDFSSYDNDGDGKVDVVIIIHQGAGEEASGDTSDIYSHSWSLTSAGYYESGVGQITVDGVVVDDYTMQAERFDADNMITIGLFAHEFGHTLGLPDFYDYDFSSYGIGDWGLMGYGIWNATSLSGDTPAHPSAWSKYFLGWLEPRPLFGFESGMSIENAEDNPVAYILLPNAHGVGDWSWTSAGEGEYFLVENRQQRGFDTALPGSGLLIWHVDETILDNDDESRKLLDLEAADGGDDLDGRRNYGDGGDPFPGTTSNTIFSDYSAPGSGLYDGQESGLVISGIGSSGGLVSADFYDPSSLAWQIKGTGDFDGDGRSDVLWQQADAGTVFLWLMDGFDVAACRLVSDLDDLGWRIRAAGDFDGDGLDDILWRHETSGATYIWIMEGVDITNHGGFYAVSDTDWQIRGVGDFDGDGRDDILWRHEGGGAVCLWLMAGLAIKRFDTVAAVSNTDWQIGEIGDFDGDGRADVIWRHSSSGTVYAWLMNGLEIKDYGGIQTVSDMDWQMKASGDVDGSGRSGIFWHHAGSGQVCLWFMAGAAIDSFEILSVSTGTDWEIAGEGDFDGDGLDDILWRNNLSGSAYIWKMDGAVITGHGGP